MFIAVATAVAFFAPTFLALGGCVPSRRRIALSIRLLVRASKVVVGGGRGAPRSSATGNGGWAGTTRMVANNVRDGEDIQQNEQAEREPEPLSAAPRRIVEDRPIDHG